MEFKLAMLRPGILLLLNKNGVEWLAMFEEEILKKEFSSTYKFSILATNLVNGLDVAYFANYDFVAGIIKVKKIKRSEMLLCLHLEHKFPLWDEFFRR